MSNLKLGDYIRSIWTALGAQRNLHTKFELKDFDLILCGLLFFDPTGGNPNPTLSLVRYAIVAYLLIKYARCASRLPVPILLLVIFSVVMGCTTFFNTGRISQACAGVRFGFQVIASYLVFIDAVRRSGSSRVLFLLIASFCIALLVNDILMFVLPYDRSDATVVYPLGGKFTVSYGHAFLVCLFMMVVPMRRVFLLCLGALCAFMAYSAGSTTGLIVVLVVMLLSIVPQRMRVWLSHPFTVAIAVVLLNLLIWGPVDIFSTQLVRSFVVNVLGKAPNMTGRIGIYDITMQFVSQKPLFGWGFQTDIYRQIFGYGNAQNGVFHMVTQCGIVGTALYFAALFLSFGRNIIDREKCYGLYSFLLAMVVASTVEITLSSQFALCIALISSIEINEGQVPQHARKKRPSLGLLATAGSDVASANSKVKQAISMDVSDKASYGC